MLTDAAASSRNQSAPVTPPDVTRAPSGSGRPESLVAQATDPRTGAVDTAALAAQVAQAARHDFSRADAAFQQISAELAQHSPAVAGEFERQVAEAARDGSNGVPGPTVTGAAQGATAAGTRTLIDNPILSVQWEPTRSAWTGKVGFTPGLTQILDRNGLAINPPNNVPPPGSVGRGSGHGVGTANNINGTAAETAIADRLRAQGFDVQTQVVVQDGQRRLDVVGTRTNADPRFNERVEVESKVGRTGPTPRTISEATLDGERLADNRTMRAAGRTLDTVGRVARPVGLVVDAIEVGGAFRADGGRVGENTGRAVSGLAGGAAGGYGGAVAGAAIGTAIFPGVGTVVGGIVGGALGALGGDAAGRGLFDSVKGWF
ncbi:hypothetical protein [Sphingomonas lenta]|uniref:Glycine zipper domain-containing protein n=1 Tax=Sphingomonas lenta TaxID=1141887 RepID=A0A2A2SFD8_9SPHN|nr:hypothetical protein [Sphingomonas lenta]PAX07912.1 hypothetical protein CKY28_09890 [Sphingomonas lenta]